MGASIGTRTPRRTQLVFFFRFFPPPDQRDGGPPGSISRRPLRVVGETSVGCVIGLRTVHIGSGSGNVQVEGSEGRAGRTAPRDGLRRGLRGQGRICIAGGADVGEGMARAMGGACGGQKEGTFWPLGAGGDGGGGGAQGGLKGSGKSGYRRMDGRWAGGYTAVEGPLVTDRSSWQEWPSRRGGGGYPSPFKRKAKGVLWCCMTNPPCDIPSG